MSTQATVPDFSEVFRRLFFCPLRAVTVFILFYPNEIPFRLFFYTQFQHEIDRLKPRKSFPTLRRVEEDHDTDGLDEATRAELSRERWANKV